MKNHRGLFFCDSIGPFFRFSRSPTPATKEEINELSNKFIDWKNNFISEVRRISPVRAKQYETLGSIDIKPFLNVRDLTHRQYLAIIKKSTKCIKSTIKLLDKYDIIILINSSIEKSDTSYLKDINNYFVSLIKI